MNTQLYRSEHDRMIAGVCGGLGQYLNLDVTLIRLFFVLLALGDGIGVMLYIILWLVMPEESQVDQSSLEKNAASGAGQMAEKAGQMGQDVQRAISSPHPQTGLIIGAALIGMGVLFLLRNLDLFWLSWLSLDVLWPVLLIIGGIVLLVRRTRDVS